MTTPTVTMARTTTPTTKRRALGYLSPKSGFQSAEFTIPVIPVPCPRPRLTRWGQVYYPPKYEVWRQQAAPHIPQLPAPLGGALGVIVVSVLPPFKTVIRDYPSGDVDNYAKSVLDIIGKAQCVWSDDTQVVVLSSSKRFTQLNEEPHSYVYIREVSPQ